MRSAGTLFVVVGALLGTAAACGSSNSPAHQGSPSGGQAGSGARGGRAGNTTAGGSGGDDGGGERGGSSSLGGDDGAGADDSGGTRTGGHSGRSVGGTGVGGSSGNHAAGGSGDTGATAGASGDTGATAGASGDTGATAGVSGAGSGGTAPVAVTLTVDTSADEHEISPLIYGINPLGVACSDATAHFGLCRLGGSRWSTYNWENNASNGGFDLCFQNDGQLGASDDAARGVTETIAEAAGIGAATLVTVPILDYVAADKNAGSGPPDCTGDVTQSGADYLETRFKKNVAAKGAPFVTPPDTSDDSVYADEFVAFLHDNKGAAEVLLTLDNQPGIWDTTHSEVHETDPTYAEVVARNVEFATSARAVWPTVLVTGYVGYGYNDFVDLQGAPDAAGNGTFIDYYLAHMKEASEAASVRLVDYLDVHWFSEVYTAEGRITGEGASPETQRERVQAPRSLWDDSYVESSWITGFANGGQPIRLVRWLQERIAAGYPGTQLAISEWAYGGGADISGAVAAADALGIFGREGVGLAAWRSTGSDPFVLAAFRMFRNYDGAGAKFGDVSVAATSSSSATASIYASKDQADPNRVVLVAINRAEGAVMATLSVTDPQTFATADVFVLTGASSTPASAPPLTVGAPNTFAYEMPGYSVSVIVPKP